MRRLGRAFLPPKNNRLVISLTKLLLPFYMQGPLGGLSVRISEADLEKLRSFKGQRLLLLPNHPTGEEPFVIGEISRRLNESFNYMAARELFTWMGGFQGWYMQRAGAYSVIRGAVDRDSFAMTQKILTEGRNPLVIFIEGEMSHENDTLIP